MHRTQVMLEEHQYRLLKRESEQSGRSIGELVRAAVDEKFGGSQERLREALEASWGVWADRDDIGDGADYVDRIRTRSVDERLTELGLE